MSEILLSLNLLAFLFHNVLDLVNDMYQKVRGNLGTRKRFFNDIRALLNYVWFQSWNDLFIFILTEGEKRESVNTSKKKEVKKLIITRKIQHLSQKISPNFHKPE